MKLFTWKTLAATSLVLLSACDQAPELPAQPTVQSSFDKADANRDGVIQRNEATSIGNREFADVDTDGNEAVSIDEFEVAVKNPGPPRG